MNALSGSILGTTRPDTLDAVRALEADLARQRAVHAAAQTTLDGYAGDADHASDCERSARNRVGMLLQRESALVMEVGRYKGIQAFVSTSMMVGGAIAWATSAVAGGGLVAAGAVSFLVCAVAAVRKEHERIDVSEKAGRVQAELVSARVAAAALQEKVQLSRDAVQSAQQQMQFAERQLQVAHAALAPEVLPGNVSVEEAVVVIGSVRVPRKTDS